MDRVISTAAENETLDDLDAEDVFTRCLNAFEVPAKEWAELPISYNEIIKDFLEEHHHAE